jgi:hypothetical protein
MSSNVRKARARLTTATANIRLNRTIGGGRSDDEILKEDGYHDANDYWRDALSQEMEVSDFVRLLESRLLDPARTADERRGVTVPARMLIESSLREAIDNGEPWFIRGREGALKLQPRRASEWFMHRPLDQDRLPTTLRAFLESGNGAQTPAVMAKAGAIDKQPLHAPRRRGRKPVVLRRVTQEMLDAIARGEMTSAELEVKAEKVLSSQFKASRDTCRKARYAVLSRIVDNGILDNSSTNDN